MSMDEFSLHKNDKTKFQEHTQNDKEAYDEKATKERTIVGSQAKTKRIKRKKRKQGTKKLLVTTKKTLAQRLNQQALKKFQTKHKITFTTSL